jgi:hypothetical protein
LLQNWFFSSLALSVPSGQLPQRGAKFGAAQKVYAERERAYQTELLEEAAERFLFFRFHAQYHHKSKERKRIIGDIDEK